MPRLRAVRSSAAVLAGCLTVTVGVAGAAAATRATHHGRPAPAAGAATTTAASGAVAAVAAPPVASTLTRAQPPAGRSRTVAGSPGLPVPAAVAPAVVHVPRLHRLTPPDAVVSLPHAARPAAVSRLRRLSGITRVAVLDRGSIRLPTGRLRVAGVPLAGIREFAPKLTAVSTPLWKSVGRGELTVSYSAVRRLKHRLGATLPARGARGARTPLRIGAFATVDIGNAQALVSSHRARSLGLAPRRQVLVAAPRISLDDLRHDVSRTLGSRARVRITRPEPFDQSVLSSYAAAAIPSSYLDLYRRAATTCPGLPWTVLAGIGTVETGNGANVHRSIAGAEGPMQFMPATWRMYGIDANGDGKADIQDPTDAVFSAARYLCAAGAGRGGQSIDNAIFSYNHAWWYVREVLVIANRYA